MMKKHIIFTICVLIVLGILVGCSNPKENDEASFTAIVLEKGEIYLMVEPEEGYSELASADKISVSVGEATLVDAEGKEIAMDGIEVGDRVQIFYDGQIAESYPAQIHRCHKVVLSK